LCEDLWQAIESHVDPADTTNDIHAEQRLHHDRFIAPSTRTFIGREELLERMLSCGGPRRRWLQRVWDVARAETVMSFTGDGELRTCAVTPDGQTIIAGEDSGRLHFLRCETVDSRARL
jgi:hypothetical protein